MDGPSGGLEARLHALGQRLYRQIGLGSGDFGKGELEHQPLVCGGTHLTRSVPEYPQGTGQPVHGAKGGRLALESRQLFRRGGKYVLACPDRGDHVHVAQVGRKLPGELQ